MILKTDSFHIKATKKLLNKLYKDVVRVPHKI